MQLTAPDEPTLVLVVRSYPRGYRGELPELMRRLRRDAKTKGCVIVEERIRFDKGAGCVRCTGTRKRSGGHWVQREDGDIIRKACPEFKRSPGAIAAIKEAGSQLFRKFPSSSPSLAWLPARPLRCPNLHPRSPG